LKAVVLAGDRDNVERFKLYVLGKPVIDYPASALSSVYDLYLLTSGWTWNDYPVIVQRSEGIMGAVKDAVEELGLPLVVSYGDVVAEEGFYRSITNDCSVVTVPFVPEERHNTIDEHSSFVFAGLFSIDEDCYSEMKRFNDIISAIKFLVKEGLMDVVRYDGAWYDIDERKDILKAFPELLKSMLGKKSVIEVDLPESVVIEGPVLIEEGSMISPFTYIKGPAYIGRGSKVGPFSVIDSSSVEPRAEVESHVNLSLVSVQPNVKVPSHSSYRFDVLG